MRCKYLQRALCGQIGAIFQIAINADRQDEKYHRQPANQRENDGKFFAIELFHLCEPFFADSERQLINEEDRDGDSGKDQRPDRNVGQHIGNDFFARPKAFVRTINILIAQSRKRHHEKADEDHSAKLNHEPHAQN